MILFLLGIGIAFVQVLPTFFLSEAETISGQYLNLCNFDCGWYRNIAEQGYHSIIPPVGAHPELTNVGFFPGYPYLARGLVLLTGIPGNWALLLLAQTSASLFWFLFFLLLKERRVSSRTMAFSALAIFSHPAAFFLVSGYSESLFFASFLGLIYFTQKLDLKWGSIAGFFHSATRIVGLPLTFYPLFFAAFSQTGSKKQLQSLSFLTALSLLGGLGFLVYCQIFFGSFTFYLQVQNVAFGVTPDYTAIFTWPYFFQVPWINRATLAISCFLFPLFLGIEYFFSKNWRRRAPLYLSAALLCYLSISGIARTGYPSIIRYSLGWWILFVLAGADLFPQILKKSKNYSFVINGIFICVALFCYFFIELPDLRSYLHSQWFARLSAWALS